MLNVPDGSDRGGGAAGRGGPPPHQDCPTRHLRETYGAARGACWATGEVLESLVPAPSLARTASMWDDVLASLATAPVSSGSSVLRPYVASLVTVNPSCIWHMMDPGEEGCRVVACVTASHAAMPKAMLHVSAVHAAHAHMMVGLRRATRRRPGGWVRGQFAFAGRADRRCHARGSDLFFATHASNADQRRLGANRHGAVKPQGGNCFTPGGRQKANGGLWSSSCISPSGNRSSNAAD